MQFLPNWCLKRSSETLTTNRTDQDEDQQGREREDEERKEGGGGRERSKTEVFRYITTRLKLLPFVRGNFKPSSGTKTHLTNALLTVVVAGVVGLVVYFSRDSVRRVLLWVAQQEVWVVVLVFLALFTTVSLPLMWGYIVVNVAAGYMFGTWRGLGVVVSTATLGVLLAHLLIRGCLRQVVQRRLVKSRLLRSLLEVLGGSQAFKVIAITRLTPIPFGLQNAVFAVSRVPTWLYLFASVLGLFPTQLLNSYLGTTVRSLDDVVAQSSSASAAGWGVFVVQILISVGLTMWVVRLAKAELNRTMAAQLPEEQPDQLGSPRPSPTPSQMSSATPQPSPTPLGRDASPRLHSSLSHTSVSPTPSVPLFSKSPTPSQLSVPPTMSLMAPDPSIPSLLREASTGKRRLRMLRRISRMFQHQQVAPIPPFLVCESQESPTARDYTLRVPGDEQIKTKCSDQPAADCCQEKGEEQFTTSYNDKDLTLEDASDVKNNVTDNIKRSPNTQ